ncbi:MAG: hypothetical protein EA403_04900 [Spirochaetaceae bacterium]|nr:MAG: hypothetical protein EA403_04900 [Spirochaetaceae bacterium]
MAVGPRDADSAAGTSENYRPSGRIVHFLPVSGRNVGFRCTIFPSVCAGFPAAFLSLSHNEATSGFASNPANAAVSTTFGFGPVATREINRTPALD